MWLGVILLVVPFLVEFLREVFVFSMLTDDTEGIARSLSVAFDNYAYTVFPLQILGLVLLVLAVVLPKGRRN
jgi:hypothetical protein